MASCFGNFVEHDGIARSVLVILFMTTIGCFAYTWGYYEGISNAKTTTQLDRVHLHQQELAHKNISQTKKLFTANIADGANGAKGIKDPTRVQAGAGLERAASGRLSATSLHNGGAAQHHTSSSRFGHGTNAAASSNHGTNAAGASNHGSRVSSQNARNRPRNRRNRQ